MSNSKSKQQQRDNQKHISSHKSQNKQAADAARAAGLNQAQAQRFHRELTASKKRGYSYNYEDMVRLAESCKY